MGSSFKALTAHSDANIGYVASSGNIYGFDLDSGISWLHSSSSEGVGTGEPIGNVSAMHVTDGRLLVLDAVSANYSKLVEVDTVTGNRTLLKDLTADDIFTRMGAGSTMHAIYLTSGGAPQLSEFDIDTKQLTILSSSVSGIGGDDGTIFSQNSVAADNAGIGYLLSEQDNVLVTVDVFTGYRALMSDLLDTSLGDVPYNAQDINYDAVTGRLIFNDTREFVSGHNASALYWVDLDVGNYAKRSLLTGEDVSQTTLVGVGPQPGDAYNGTYKDIFVDPARRRVIAGVTAGTLNVGLFLIDMETGDRVRLFRY